MTTTRGLVAALLAGVALAGSVLPAAAQDEGVDVFVIGGKADDPFFAKIKKGVDEAALIVEAHGGTVTYLPLQTYDNIGGDAADLIRNAISQDADVIAAPNWVPDAEDEAYRAALDAGIPVMLYNSGGAEKAAELGAINYIGNEEYPAGVAAGEYFGTHDIKNVICVNTVPGAQNLEDRCRGVADGIAQQGGVSNQLPLPATSFGNPTAVAEAIKAALLRDETIDGVITISAGDANSAAIAIQQGDAGDRVSLGSFDMDEEGLNRIKDGAQLFAVDQQPYLQGFLAVTLSEAYVSFALETATDAILTGPAIVDAANVEATIAGTAAGYR
jgi:simple sugar transport system substrate-binding protein